MATFEEGGLAQVQRAVREAEAALRRKPADVEARIDLARALLHAGELLRALETIQQALAAAPQSARAHFNASEILFELGEFDGALAFARSAAAAAPTWPNARYLRGFRALAHGLWAEAWADLESRLEIAEFQRMAPPPAVPRWQGEALTGRHVVVDAEQGHGDSIQYVRFVPRLVERGARVTLRVQEPLVTLLDQFPGVRVTSITTPPQDPDLRVELLSLPHLLGHATDEGLGRAPYLAPTGPAPEALDALLPSDPRPTVGMVWEARAAHPTSRRRSLPPGALELLVRRHPNLRFVSLQHFVDTPGQAAEALPAGVVNAAPACTDFNRTAHVMARLDHVVSVDTGPAHLAGALGVPTTVLVNFAPDARWLLHRADSPWYGSVRVIRQERPYDWAAAVVALSASLEALR